MKIILAGASGTMDKHLIQALEKDHELIKVSANKGSLRRTGK